MGVCCSTYASCWLPDPSPFKTMPAMTVGTFFAPSATRVPMSEKQHPKTKKYRRPKMSDSPPASGNTMETVMLCPDSIQL